MIDPYRPPEARLARRPETPPIWESFVTWGVAVISILFGLLWWVLLALGVITLLGDDVVPRYFRTWRYWLIGLTFTMVLSAGITLLMSRSITLPLYAGSVLATLLWAAESRMAVPLLVINALALTFTLWSYVLKRRGRFRRSSDAHRPT